jgi:hypothetical protein
MPQAIQPQITGVRFKLPILKPPAKTDGALKEALTTIGQKLVADIRAGMREFTGAGKKSVKFKVELSGWDLKVTVSSTNVEAIIEETGRRAGAKMAPWKQGSGLFNWVRAKGFRGASLLATRRRTVRFTQKARLRGGAVLTRGQSLNRELVSIAFLISRKQARDGIPARHLFTRTLEANRAFIQETLDAAYAQMARGQMGH